MPNIPFCSKTAILFAYLSLLFGCAHVPPAERPTLVSVEDGELRWQGPITAIAVERFLQALEQHADSVDILVIESEGGPVEPALQVGHAVLDHRLDVRVEGRGCFSSCANYVFTAGRNKVIAQGAVVAWHGSAIQFEWGRAGRDIQFAAHLAEMRARQAEFFARIDVDERVTVVGQDLACSCTWALSVDDMARFGIKDVDAPEDYAQTPIAWGRRSGLRFLSLPDDAFSRIRQERLDPPSMRSQSR